MKGKPEKKRICKKCLKEFLPLSGNQKLCGSYAKREGCSYEKHRKGKGRQEVKCKMCGKIFLRNSNQIFCGSREIKGSCAFKNYRADKRWGKVIHKVCISCEEEYIPSGQNQKFCGSKNVKGTCSWNNQHNIMLSYEKKKAPWLSGMTIKI